MSVSLCAITDVEALAGTTVPTDEVDRVNRLIELSSSVVANACVTLPSPTPDNVALVTATMVVRQLANPSGAVSEMIAGYRAAHKGGAFELTDDLYRLLGPWAAAVPGKAAFSVFTPSPFAVDPVGTPVFDHDDYPVPLLMAPP